MDMKHVFTAGTSTGFLHIPFIFIHIPEPIVRPELGISLNPVDGGVTRKIHIYPRVKILWGDLSKDMKHVNIFI